MSEIVWLRVLDTSGSWHPCAKGDPGAAAFVKAALPSGYEGLADKIAADTFNHLRHWQLDEVVTNAFHGAIQKAAAEAIATLGGAARLFDDHQPMSCEVGEITAAEDVLSWLIIEKCGAPYDRSYTPHEAQKIIEDALALATPPAPQPPLALIEAKPLDEWHEDDGFVVWWTLKDGNWLGEPSYIGSPLCDDWPGYHTHWTPHPAFPAPASAKRFKGE